MVSKKINCLFQRLLQNPIEHLNTSLLLQHIMQKKENKPSFTCFILLLAFKIFPLFNRVMYCSTKTTFCRCFSLYASMTKTRQAMGLPVPAAFYNVLLYNPTADAQVLYISFGGCSSACCKISGNTTTTKNFFVLPTPH